MPKYLSGRSKRRSQDKLTDDRYQYLGLDQAEPNLGDPPEGDAIPAGTQYQIVSLENYPGQRFWKEVGGGLIPGSFTIRDEGLVVPRTDAEPNLGINSITDVNFVGLAVTVIGFLKPDGDAGSAVTVTVAPPGDNHQVLFNDDGEFATSPYFTFDNTIGIGSVGIGTSEPLHNLHVVGDVKLDKTIYDEENQPGNQGDLLVKTATGGIKWNSANSINAGAGGTIKQIQFHDSTGFLGGADNFVFDFTNDRIGIGSTEPDRLLDVLGDSRFTGFTTFTDDVEFISLNDKNILFDKSDNSLKFGNNVKAKFGDTEDLEIYHTGSQSYIDNNKGPLYIRNNVDDDDGANIIIEAKSGKASAVFQDDEGVRLYYNDGERIGTTPSGVDVSGTLDVTGISTLTGQVGFGTHATFPNDAEIRMGTNNDLTLVHEADGETTIRENGTGNFNILGTDIVFKNSSLSNSKKYAEFKNGDSVDLFFNNAKKFQTTGAGVSVTGLTSTTNLEVDQYVVSDLIPDKPDTYNLGSQSLPWDNVYAKRILDIVDLNLENLNVTGITTTKDLVVTGLSTFKGISYFESNVGIGTTRPFDSYGTGFEKRLEVVSGGAAPYLFSGGDFVDAEDVLSVTTKSDYGGFNINVRNQNENNPLWTIRTFQNEPIAFGQGLSEIARFDGNGNLGIGTTSPSGKLHISSGTSGDCKLIIESDTDNSNENNNPYIIFRQDGGIEEAAIWKGTHTPDSGSNDNTLHIVNTVDSTTHAGGIKFLTGDTSLNYENAVTRMMITRSGEVNIGGNYAQSTYKMRVTGTVAATHFDSLSDLKLKTNVKQIQNPIETVKKINGVTFNWKEDNDPSMGVIAQNVEKILPEIVSGEDVKSVNYSGLIGLLIEVVKNQQDQINELRSLLDK